MTRKRLALGIAALFVLMLVSRGVGNSIIPLRIHNPPEIVVAELCVEK